MPEVTYIEDRKWYKRFKLLNSAGNGLFRGSNNNAMFKGVPFIIDGADSTFGRRTVEHEYPQKDIPYSEDLGRALRKFSVDGMLIGDDYLTQRDNLVFVCEEEGAGELVHPYYGFLNVVCKSIRVTDTRGRAGVCSFRAEFVETGALTFPIVSSDTTSLVENTVTTAIANNKSAFQRVYGLAKQAVAKIEGQRETLRQGFEFINKAKTAVNMPATYVKKYNAYLADIDALVLNAESLVDATFDLVTFGFIGADRDDDIPVKESYLEFQKNSIDFASTALTTSDDGDLIQNLIQEATVVTMCLLTSRIDYESTNEAIYYRDTVLNKIDSLLEGDLDDQVIQDFRDLRASVAEDIDTRSLELPQLSSYTPAMTMPALVISHSLYGNVDEEQNIIERNRIQHPAFVSGGAPIEVLLNV